MTAQPHSSQNPAAGSTRRVLAQCDRCGAKASAIAKRGRLSWSELAHFWIPADGMKHSDCGRRIVGYDIEERD